MKRQEKSHSPIAIAIASRATRGNGGHMIEVAGLWTRAGIDR